MRIRFLAPLALVLCPALMAGCGVTRTTTAPDAARAATSMSMLPVGASNGTSGGFYPLEIGNRWRFAHRFSWTITPDGGVPGDPQSVEYERDVTLDRQTPIDGRIYVMERSDYLSDPPIDPTFAYLRQDRGGLFEHDPPNPPPKVASAVASRAPGMVSPAWPEVAARLGVSVDASAWRIAWERLQAKRARVYAMLFAPARPGPADGEIQSLSYPLHQGATWTVRQDPRFTARVEGQVSVDSPAGRFAAWSIRIDNEFLSPTDEVHLFYGRAGYLGLSDRLSSIATDESGNPIGTIDSHESETPLEVSLVDTRAAAAGPLGLPRSPTD